MSVSTKFYTFRAMDDAIVIDVSSDNANHPAEHALILEPNFSWEADEADAQHYLTTDLTRPFIIDSLVWIHRDEEAISPSPWGLTADVYYSNDNSTYTKATLTVDPGINAALLKVAEFSITGAYRYWKIVIKGTDDPSYYAAEDTRVSAVWWARKYTITSDPIFPMNDTIIHLQKQYNAAYGNQNGVGFNTNEIIQFTRTYTVDDDDYENILNMLMDTNGGKIPVVMQELNNDPILVKVKDAVTIQKFTIDYRTVVLTFSTVPVVGRDEFY